LRAKSTSNCARNGFVISRWETGDEWSVRCGELYLRAALVTTSAASASPIHRGQCATQSLGSPDCLNLRQ
jgi:hypothetical protein